MKNKLSSNATEIILQSISDGVFTVNHKWKITSFNKAAENITGVLREEALGKYCWEVFSSSMCERECPVQAVLNTGKPVVNKSAYIIKKNGSRIPIAVSAARLMDENSNVLGGVETFRDLSEVEELRKELNQEFQVADVVSRSKSMHKIFKILPRIAGSESTILLQGETGTGKELMAKAIHHLSPRKDKPFLAVNCGALPDSLLESELFGYKAGAFTDASKDKSGLFQAASGGSILLDEIGETSNAFQVKLLRVLQEKEFTPLGDVQPVKADLRILAATNKDLSEMVSRKEFREDLYYRINVVQLKLPPLRERKEDIPLLCEHFLQRLNSLYKKNIQEISPGAMAILMGYDFPGNIRELENILEYASVLCTEETIQPGHLPEYLHSPESSEDTGQSLQNCISATESKAILTALENNNYNKTKTAKELGMHKSTLYRKIKKLGLNLQDLKSKGRENTG